MGTRDVVSAYRRSEAVLRVVGDAQRVLLRVERHDDRERTEPLFAGDAHFRSDIGEYRRFHIEAAGLPQMLGHPAASDKPSAFVTADPDEVQNALALALRDDRSHLCRLVKWITDTDALGLGSEFGDECVIDRALYQMS